MLRDGHSSGPRIAAGLKRPTRRLWRAEPARVTGKARRLTRKSLPIWSCSVWGLPCPPHYCAGGALLPHLFTLTWALRPGRYVFCGTFRRTGLNRPSRTLSGTLLCGVRTFLPPCGERPSGPAANPSIIVQAIVQADRARRLAQSENAAVRCPPRWRILSLHLFGREKERVCQHGQANQQRNQSGEIDRLVAHQPTQKRHYTDTDDGGDQSA